MLVEVAAMLVEAAAVLVEAEVAVEAVVVAETVGGFVGGVVGGAPEIKCELIYLNSCRYTCARSSVCNVENVVRGVCKDVIILQNNTSARASFIN